MRSLKSWTGFAAALLLAVPVFAQVSDDEGADAAIPNRYFVELPSPPTADGTSLSTIQAERTAFRNEAKRRKLAYTEKYAFGSLWNGLSIELADPVQVAKLYRMSSVKAVYPVYRIEAPSPDRGNFEPNLASALAMTGADIVHSSLGFTGAGVKVGVIDTGTDYDHPDLGGCFGGGCKVAYGYDFVGDAFDASAASPVIAPDADPDDCNGHGTHVSGIVAADGTVTGVAPGATLGAYRVFGCVGSTASDIMIDAMEMAYADGMQVVNMSIGSTREWAQYPTAAAATKLVDLGVVVVCSQGNSEGIGVYGGSAPATGTKVIGVGAIENDIITAPAFEVNTTPTPTLISYIPATGAPLPPLSGTEDIFLVGTTSSTNAGCTSSGGVPAGASGKLALIRRGSCSFREKSLNAMAAGATGVILFNNVAGTLSATVAGTPAITIPVVGITAADGAIIAGIADPDPKTATWGFSETSANPFAGRVTSFSSWGPTPELEIKPDISAPGGNIWSTVPLERGAYANFSGTSMASPHVAGAAALLLEAHPNTPSQVMGALLQNSADPVDWWLIPALGNEPVHRQGAGLLDIDDAILATVKIEPGELSLGEGEFGPITRTLTLENRGASDVTFDLSSESAIATYTDMLIDNAELKTFYFSDELVGFSQSAVPVTSVLVPADGTATLDVTVTPDTLGLAPDWGLYSGHVHFDPQGGGQSYTVPYLGTSGDYQDLTILAPTATVPAPFIVDFNDALATPFTPQTVYTLADLDNVPTIVVHLRHQARKLRVEARSTTGKMWHRAYDENYVIRNSSQGTTGYFVLPWDGTTIAGKKLYTVPDGDYVLRLSVLKAGSDTEWESYTFAPITIDRP
jgi:subtilisin family serine protease